MEVYSLPLTHPPSAIASLVQSSGTWLHQTTMRRAFRFSFCSVLVTLISVAPFFAESVQVPCGSGQYRLRRHGQCTPCKECDQVRVISPCSPTHDTVCADELRSRVFHFPCKKRGWGLFLEGKSTSFRNLKERERTEVQRKLCGILEIYRKRILDSTPRYHNRCGNGTFQWARANKSDVASHHLDCRPCLQCPTGTRVMSSCGGFQDTLCSIVRGNGSMEVMELFRMQCPEQGPTIQVYSDKPPAVSTSRLVYIQSKVQNRLCHAVTHQVLRKPVVMTAVNEGNPKSRKSARKCQTNVGGDIKSENRSRKFRKCEQNGGKSRSEKRRKGAASFNKNVVPFRKTIDTVSTTTTSTTTTTTNAVLAALGITPQSPSDTTTPWEAMETRRHWTVTLEGLSEASQAKSGFAFTERGITPEEAEFEEDDEKKQDRDADDGDIYFALAVSVSVLLVILIITAAIMLALRGKARRKCEYIDDIVNKYYSEESIARVLPGNGVCDDRASSSAESSSHVLRIVDPLRVKNRHKSLDSGYISFANSDSCRGSLPVCSEDQVSDDTLLSQAVCTDKSLVRNAVSNFDIPKNHVGDPVRPFDHKEHVLVHSICYATHARAARGRLTQSLSENPSCSAIGARRKPCTPSQPYDCDTDPSYSGDEGIEKSQESVFCSTSRQDMVKIKIPLVKETPSMLEFYNTSGSLSSECGSETSAAVAQMPAWRSCFSTKYEFGRTFPAPRPQGCSVESLLSDGVPGCPRVSTETPKARNPSGDSSASSSVSIQVRIPLNNDIWTRHENTDWFHKTSEVGPENFLSTHSSSIMTQTEDWTKTNLRPRPMFSGSWQGFHSFSDVGGLWALNGSDVRLEVPPHAVAPVSYADVTAATYTNLAHLRRVLNLADEEVIVGPLAELDAGPGFRFQQPVRVFYPHGLPPGSSEEQIKLYHLHKDSDGGLVTRRLPSKREYDLRQETASVASGCEEPFPSEDAESDIGYFHLMPSGELQIVTRQFCGYLCTICSKRNPLPKIHLLVSAKQLLKSRPSGDLRQVKIGLHLWDRKLTITDFKRDYLGDQQVGEQTLHLIDEPADSLVKTSLTIHQEEAQQQWKLALRPGTSQPIFPAEKSFRLRELMCCHAKDEPRCEEWLAENVLEPGEPCYDFQCFIDVANVAHPASSLWQEAGATQDLLEKSVTLFIGDVNNNNSSSNSFIGINSINSHPAAAEGVAKNIPPYGGEQQTAAKNKSGCHQDPCCQYPSTFSDAIPYGRMEQGGPESLQLSDIPGWQPLSDEVDLGQTWTFAKESCHEGRDQTPPRHTPSRVSDPNPQPVTGIAQQVTDERTDFSRSLSCPGGQHVAFSRAPCDFDVGGTANGGTDDDRPWLEPASSAEDQVPKDEPETALSDSNYHINMLFL
ncbi:uncharacterized protein LOC143293524 isoform X2 [Babylonia areolata]|uniref:uncharacterized protein LOC143293524 isoform X2 n=1 Tax=Babylonia areolata TaxID=304850 RepID=UPI003FD51B68